MTIIDSVALEKFRARREGGETVKEIARSSGIKAGTLYQQFNRKLGGTPMPGPANDNNPDRVTRMTPRNGGCSSTSGKMPVTLVRIPSLDANPVAMSARERQIAANDNRQNGKNSPAVRVAA